MSVYYIITPKQNANKYNILLKGTTDDILKTIETHKTVYERSQLKKLYNIRDGHTHDCLYNGYTFGTPYELYDDMKDGGGFDNYDIRIIGNPAPYIAKHCRIEPDYELIISLTI